MSQIDISIKDRAEIMHMECHIEIQIFSKAECASINANSI